MSLEQNFASDHLLTFRQFIAEKARDGESSPQEESLYSFFPNDFESRFASASSVLHLVGKLSANLPEIVSEHMAPEIQAYWAQSMQRNSAEVVLFNLMIIEELKSVMNVLFHLESAASQKQLSSHSYVNKADYMTEKSSELDQLYRRSYKGGWAAETLSLVRLFVRLSPNMRKLNSVAIFTALK